MATGARGRGNAGAAAPEKLEGLAEERFHAGDVAGALRVVREAQARCCTPLPSSLAHALAAYEVHATFAASRPGGRDWYAVLGLSGAGGGAVTREDIKRRYRRLCLVLHPDKNRSAAADGAFKLLQEAWTALSARHPAPAPPEQKPSNHSRPPLAAAAPNEAEKRRAKPPAASYTSCSFGRKPRRGTPPQPRTFRSDYVETPRRGGGYRSSPWPGLCPVPGCSGEYVQYLVAVDMWKLRCVSCRHESGAPQISANDLLHDLYTAIGSTRSTEGRVYQL